MAKYEIGGPPQPGKRIRDLNDIKPDDVILVKDGEANWALGIVTGQEAACTYVATFTGYRTTYHFQNFHLQTDRYQICKLKEPYTFILAGRP